MSSGNRIHLSARVTGILLVPEGAPTIYTLERGQVVTVVQVRPESNIVEVEANSHRLLFSRDALRQNGSMVSAA